MFHDVTFPYRLAAGLSFFVVMLAVEFWKRPSEPRRRKEYSFLAGITVAAMGYGVAHDFVTWSICRSYYVIGKGIPTASYGYTWDVVKLAMKATWSVGLIAAAVLLVANNPDRERRQLPYRRLVAFAAVPLVVSMVLEGLLGLLFYWRAAGIAASLGMQEYYDLAGAPFMAVWGMHIGAYGGGAAGLVCAAILVVRAKRRIERDNAGPP